MMFVNYIIADEMRTDRGNSCWLLSPDGQKIQSLLQKLRGFPASTEDLEVRHSRNLTHNEVVDVSNAGSDRAIVRLGG